MDNLPTIATIQDVIITVRDTPVILDSEVAKLYGVETRIVNQAVKRNLDKFPDGYILELDKNERDILKSQNVISIPEKGGRVKLPNAFTEKGLYMLATILKSNIATQTTIQIIETFSKVRELNKIITNASDNDKQIAKKGSVIINDIFNEGLDFDVNATETTVEVNLTLLKWKKTIKKGK
jgi:hypothetical protein